MHMYLLLFLSVTLMLLLTELSTTGWELLSRRFYSQSVEAEVIENRVVLEPQSKGLVEYSADGKAFERISSTEDRETGYFPLLFLLTEKNRYQTVFQWQVDGTFYRGYYRHLKRKPAWQAGERVFLRCRKGQPWKYALVDREVRRGFLIRTGGYLVILCGLVIRFFYTV